VVVAEEKGIDVRIAIDLIRLAHGAVYDVAILMSQDQDLAESGGRDPDHSPGTAALDQGCECVSRRAGITQSARRR